VRISFAILLAAAASLPAQTHTGLVTFGALPLPGASVVLRQAGAAERHAVSDLQGRYEFLDVAPAAFRVEVAMPLFVTQQRDFPAPTAEPATWELALLPREQRKLTAATAEPFTRTAVTATPAPPRAGPASAPAPADPDLARQAADGFLVSGSVNNAAASPFAQLGAFGNQRRTQRSLYNGSLGLVMNNAAFDARAYSLTGQGTPQPAYSRVQGLVSFGGPLIIPRLLTRGGPTLTLNYQFTRNRNATTQTGLMPTAAQRDGQFTSAIRDPLNGGAPFAGQRIPAHRLDPSALTLLRLFPTPNFSGSTRYNFQLPLVGNLHQDDLQTRANKQFRRNTFSGAYSLQSTRTDGPDLFGLLDTGRVFGWSGTAGYRRTLSGRSFFNVNFNLNRLGSSVTPFYSQRENISAAAGITGNNQDAVNWGPPNLLFTGGLTPLTVAQAARVQNQTASLAGDYFISRHGHNIAAGAVHRQQQFNRVAQQDARGTFGFTGAAAGQDFAGFLLGVPDTSAIAFGNADKYLRGRVEELFLNDDWRVGPGLTINAGLRWEYWTPVREKYGRLVNLDPRTGVANSTLPRPDRNNFAPRVAASWRPLPASSLVLRAGYGVYFDTSIYQPIAQEMSQQAPLSTSLRVSNSAATPLTLARGFAATGPASATTFGVDPDFRVGYAHTWRASVQTDLPAALQVTASYQGSQGTRGQQQFLPNTFPAGPAGPFGYAFLASNGNSSRQSADVQLRRRLRHGLTAQFGYTWARAFDNMLLGGRGRALIAQNWLDLAAERGRANTDQRHLATASIQYTTGLGLTGHKARFLKEWTLASQFTAGSGLPLSPLAPFAIAGTGYMGVLRPDFTGAPLYDAPPGLFLNPAAVRAPTNAWGNAGRNSINGPGQFLMVSSLGRTLRSWDRLSLDLRVDATNTTNTPVYPSWNVVAGHAQFGVPDRVNPMRSLQVTLRMGF